MYASDTQRFTDSGQRLKLLWGCRSDRSSALHLVDGPLDGSNTGQDTALASVAPASGHQVAHLMLWWQLCYLLITTELKMKLEPQRALARMVGQCGLEKVCEPAESGAAKRKCPKRPNKERPASQAVGICWFSLEEAILSLWRLTAELLTGVEENQSLELKHTRMLLSHLAMTYIYVGKINCLNWSTIPCFGHMWHIKLNIGNGNLLCASDLAVSVFGHFFFLDGSQSFSSSSFSSWGACSGRTFPALRRAGGGNGLPLCRPRGGFCLFRRLLFFGAFLLWHRPKKRCLLPRARHL